jgi:tetratricopeptide (TPR) repeat protein
MAGIVAAAGTSTGQRALRLPAAGLAIGVALAASAGAAAAQIPEKFENLQVLAKDISREELTGIMRGFATALGVRCQYCHPGGVGDSLEGVDFKSDEDPDKGKARHMMKMVADLNGAALAQLPDRDQPAVTVECVTCHHGLPRPVTLAAELAQAIERLGVEAAVTRYRELRKEFYGSGAYDFRANSLNGLGRSLVSAGKSAEAIVILELNAEQYPQDATAAFALGQLYARAGDREKAIASYERALRIEPDNRQAQQALQRLRGG